MSLPVANRSLDDDLNDSLTTDGNWSDHQEEQYDYTPGGDPLATVKLLICIIFSLVFIIGVFGNTLVIAAATGRMKGLHKTMSVYILNLSIADMLYLIFCLPFQATVIALPSWLFGRFMCKMFQFLTYTSMSASIFTLVAMSMDRYLAVAHPLRFFGMRTFRNTVSVVATIWVAAVGCAAPFLFVLDIFLSTDETGQTVFYCVEFWDYPLQRMRYYGFLFVACYLVPLLLMTVSYVLILRTLWKTLRLSEDVEVSANKAKKKVTMIVCVVVLAFGLCWLPHHVLYMWINFGTFRYTDGTLGLKMTEVVLSSLNSCLNPIIYSIMSENFRQALKRCGGRCSESWSGSRDRSNNVVPQHRMKLLRSKRSYHV